MLSMEGVAHASSIYPYIDAHLFDLRSRSWYQVGATLRVSGYL